MGGGAAGGGATGGGGLAGGGAAGGATGGGGVAGGGAGGAGGGSAGAGGAPNCSTHAFSDVAVPMRDGKQLSAFVRAPVDSRCRLPTVLIQTPYNKETARQMWFSPDAGQPLFDSTQYAFVVEDWRGFFGSQPARVTGPQPYGEDGYDTVEWIAQQPFSDGNVGTWGVSALCVQQYRTAALRPPHLKASVPIFCEMNTSYLQYYPGGVLRREYFSFISSYFGAGAVVLNAPFRTAAWNVAESALSAASIEVPMLVVSGWYDLIPAGTLQTWNRLVTASPRAGAHRLLMGEWIHFATGGESAGGRALSAEELQWVDTPRTIQADTLKFFDLHLRGEAQGPAAQWPAVRYSRSGTWLSATAWPPPGGTARDLFLSADGGLVDASPSLGQRSFLYQPVNPSPTLGGGTLLPSLAHGPADQTAVANRSDAVTFFSSPLGQPLHVAGALQVDLDVSTDRADTDFTARLCDVSPDGGMLLLAEGVRRLKLRSNYSAPEPVVAGTRYGVSLYFVNDLAYQFAAGHRVGLIVSSSNYPRFDKNPNTGADFFPDSGAPALEATNTLYLDGASKLRLPLSP